MMVALWTVGDRLYRWFHRHRCFFPEYQPHLNAHDYWCQLETSPSEQWVKTSMRMAFDTRVEFVALSLNDDEDCLGVPPVIKSLDDWQHGRGKKPPFVFDPYP